MKVDPPAGQIAPVSATAGVVNLSWSATPTNPGTHTLTYLVLRRVSGVDPYVQVASTPSTQTTYSDTPPADGLYDYKIQAKVAGGGVGFFTSGDSTVQTGRSDRTAPTMSVQCNAAACSAGWYTAAVTVLVSGTDAGVGMTSVSRRVDGGGWTTVGGASTSFSVSGDSAGHTVDYYGTDAVTNVSGTTTQTVKIDGTVPTKSIQCNASACLAAWYTAAVSVTVSGTDATSGMSTVTRNVDGGGNTTTAGASATFTVSGDNAGHTVAYYTTDVAGNSAASATQTIQIDGTAPTKSILCGGVACIAGWYTAAVSVTVSGTDATSGMSTVTRNVDAGGNTTTAGASATFTVSGDNAGHTVAYYTTDVAGNSAASATQTIKIDGTAPTAVTGLSSVTGTVAGTVNLTWTAGTDATSGVAGYTLRRSGVVGACPATTVANYPTTYAVPVGTTYTAGGMVSGSKYCFYMVTNDNAGNVSVNSAAVGPTKAK
ncbi:MAG TPA: hypothetical protein VGQ86_11585 [Candidatus Limnocylindria bacterium]|nr:hypothetical protein [Candidatus Limnocylindria bacterium]